MEEVEKWPKNEQVPLHLERAQAPNEEYEGIAFLPFKRKKTTLYMKFMKNGVGAITVAENILGPLDLVRADPTATINLQNRNRRGHGGGDLYMRDSEMGTCDII